MNALQEQNDGGVDKIYGRRPAKPYKRLPRVQVFTLYDKRNPTHFLVNYERIDCYHKGLEQATCLSDPQAAASLIEESVIHTNIDEVNQRVHENKFNRSFVLMHGMQPKNVAQAISAKLLIAMSDMAVDSMKRAAYTKSNAELLSKRLLWST